MQKTRWVEIKGQRERETVFGEAGLGKRDRKQISTRQGTKKSRLEKNFSQGKPDSETRLLDIFCERTHYNECVFDELIAAIQRQQLEEPASIRER